MLFCRYILRFTHLFSSVCVENELDFYFSLLELRCPKDLLQIYYYNMVQDSSQHLINYILTPSSGEIPAAPCLELNFSVAFPLSSIYVSCTRDLVRLSVSVVLPFIKGKKRLRKRAHTFITPERRRITGLQRMKRQSNRLGY